MTQPDETNPYQPPDAPGRPKALIGIVLAVLLFLAIFVPLAVVAPGLAIVFAICVLPVAIRVAAMQGARRTDGSPLGARGLLAIAFGSLALFATAATAACIAFVAICFPAGLAAAGAGGEAAILLAFIGGGAAGIAAAGIVLWKMWDLPLWLAGVKSAKPGPVDAEIVD